LKKKRELATRFCTTTLIPTPPWQARRGVEWEETNIGHPSAMCTLAEEATLPLPPDLMTARAHLFLSLPSMAGQRKKTKL
jgi:hypothetical protein